MMTRFGSRLHKTSIHRGSLHTASLVLAIAALLLSWMPWNGHCAEGDKLWEFPVGASVQSSPAIGSDGTLYFGADNGLVYALSPDGKKKWEFITSANVVSSPSIAADGTIYVASVDRILYAIAPDGTEKWRLMPGSGLMSSPALGPDGMIYQASIFSKVYAIEPMGYNKWEFPTKGNMVSSPAIGADGTIYIGSWDTNLYAIAPDGARKWSYVPEGRISSSPAIGADGMIYFGSFDQFFYAISPAGERKWDFKTTDTIRSSPVIGADGTLYFGSDDRKLYALSSTGTKKWEFVTEGWIRSSPAIAADGTLYVGSYDGRLYAIGKDGAKKWEFVTGGEVSCSPAIGTNGVVYFGSWDGKFYAVQGSGPLVDSPWPMFRRNLRHTASMAVENPALLSVALALKLPPKTSLALPFTNTVARSSEPEVRRKFIFPPADAATTEKPSTPAREVVSTTKPPVKPEPVKPVQTASAPVRETKPATPEKKPSKPPTLAITTPQANARFTDATITVQGTARADEGIARVEYRLNGADAQSTDGLGGWKARLTLQPGTNVFQAHSIDKTGNSSEWVTRCFVYAPVSQLAIKINGKGTISPNLTGENLEIGKSYTLSAEPSRNQLFTNWSGSVTSSEPKLTFVMRPNLTLEANFIPKPTPPKIVVTKLVENQPKVEKPPVKPAPLRETKPAAPAPKTVKPPKPPTIAISDPSANTRFTDPHITVQGSAKADGELARIEYRLNSTNIESANGLGSWRARVQLQPGANIIQARAFDKAGNTSEWASRSFLYTPVSQLAIKINGKGTVSPNLTGENLEIGKNYTVSAEPNRGQLFTNWSGSVTSAQPKLTFLMQSNLTLEANFIPKPTPPKAVVTPLPVVKPMPQIAKVKPEPAPKATAQKAPAAPVVREKEKPVVKAVERQMGSLVVTIGGFGKVTPDLTQKPIELGRIYTITAKPAPGYIFNGWSGGVEARMPELTFTMSSNLVINAQFIPNPLVKLAGAYFGLTQNTNSPTQNINGSFSIELDDNGRWQGKLIYGGKTHSVNGHLDAKGWCQIKIADENQRPLTITLQADIQGDTGELSGNIIDGREESAILATRQGYDGAARIAPQAGKYTLALAAAKGGQEAAMGDGFATATVDKAGMVVITGQLSDGASFSQTVGLSKQAVIPVYIPLYGNKGSLCGWLSITNKTGTDISGQLVWQKPAMEGASGVTRTIQIVGSAYIPPATEHRLLSGTNYTVMLSQGGLTEPQVNTLRLGTGSKALVEVSEVQLNLAIAAETGLFKGTFIHPKTKKSLSLRGVILQKQNWGSGYFLNQNQSGLVFLGPDQAAETTAPPANLP